MAEVEDRPEWMAAYMDYLGVHVPHGRGWAKLRCPFHDDSHASATINSEVGAFKCFGCDASGTAINLIMHNEGVDFNAAFRFVEEVLGQTVGPGGADNGGGGVSKRSGSNKTQRRYVPPRSRTWGDIG